jgi:hypothetical protein
MPRKKTYQTPEKSRLCITLNKRQLKEFKKIAVEFEMTTAEVLQISADLLIHKFQNIDPKQFDEKGIDYLFETG